MKILKVKIKKERSATSCRFSYPEGWDSQKISVLAYENHPEKLGKVEENCLCITDDATANELVKQPGVKEISKAEADVFGKKWRPARARITDEVKVMTVIKKLLSKPGAKASLRTYLNQQEVDSLDEDTPKPGIRKGKEFDTENYLE